VTDDLRGVLAILVTPFDEALQFDEESHQAQVEFAIAAGASGVISTAVYGEFFTLTDRERRRIAEATVQATSARVPVIATVSGVSTAHAVELTRDAALVGVDAVMAMPPYFAQLDTAGVEVYFRQIAAVAPGPVILQNAGDFIGAPLRPDQLTPLFEQIDGLDYLKEEVPPNPRSVGAAAATLGDRVRGIFGGHGGMYMVTEYRRGATGNMPAPEFLEITVAIDRLLTAGDEEGARALHARLVPALVWERLLGVAWTKQVLVRRGVIRSAATRMPSPALDREDALELAHLLEGLADLLTTPGPLTAA
jgi:4-hydroxy-tetrahydrodipicolinate synthase